MTLISKEVCSQRLYINLQRLECCFIGATKHADKKEKLGRHNSTDQEIDWFGQINLFADQFLLSFHCIVVTDTLLANKNKNKDFHQVFDG